ncbi:MAG: poly(A) polymerase [Proteobacteria bacterium]|nr:MAG: poly(A) polymerase [Pseudomonadota bacterium]
MEVTRKPHLHQDWIDPHAYGIVKALQKNDFETYLVGGCVRDLLLNIHPKDFDIATMAHPPQVKRLIYMSFIIGKRFRLVLVKRDDQQYEVATFRREVKAEEHPEGVPFGDNVFGTPEEDALRRDFTINALFYDPIEEKLIDYVEGLKDIDTRTLRMIGEPDVRLVEDPIRILRGLRFSHKLGLTVEPGLREAMKRNAKELTRSVLPRRREEILKILRLAEPQVAILELFDLDILQHITPTLHDLLSSPERRDLFLEAFESLRAIVMDPNDTTQLFTWLTYSMYQAAVNAPSMREQPITIHDELFQRFMRDELGMYRFEQTVLTKSIDLLRLIQKTEEFKRRGERRQLAFMKNEGFKLAMRIAESDFLLTSAQSAFWRSAYARLSSELEVLEAEVKTKRRRRPRKPKRLGQVGDKGRTEDTDLPDEEEPVQDDDGGEEPEDLFEDIDGGPEDKRPS